MAIDNAVENRQQIADIQKRYLTGKITREQAKAEAQPVLDRINAQTAQVTKELNKKYNMNRKPAKLDFINAMRNEY